MRNKILGKLFNQFISLITPDEVEKYAEMMKSRLLIIVYITIILRFLNLFDPEMQLIDTKPIIKNKLKEMLSELKKFKVQSILVLTV